MVKELNTQKGWGWVEALKLDDSACLIKQIVVYEIACLLSVNYPYVCVFLIDKNLTIWKKVWLVEEHTWGQRGGKPML